MNAQERKNALLAAGQRLAQQQTWAELRLETVAEAAALPAESMLELFGSLEGFLVALQQKFMTELQELVITAAEQRKGSQRLSDAGIAYLDYCLNQHPLRAWLLSARSDTAIVAAGLRKQNQSYISILSIEFKALNWPRPPAAARLFLSALQAIGREEHAVKRPLPELRAALWDFLETHRKPPI